MNLQLLTRSRKPPRAGDVFVVKPRDQDYYFGLVVNPLVKHKDLMGATADASWDGALVYIYNQHAPRKDVAPELDPRQLLIPPLILELAAFRSGYVETVDAVELSPDVVLPQHCFHEVARDEYLDEYGNSVSHRIEPCGIYGLTPVGGLDNKISKALGIRRAAN